MNDRFTIEPSRLIALKDILNLCPGTDARAQRHRLLMAIERLQSVCTYECSRCLDIYFPPARKRELLQTGYPIRLTWRWVATESGGLHRVGVYYLERGAA